MTTSLNLHLNGEAQSLATEPHHTLLEALRNAGLTGTKQGCDGGDCGACTVIVDGKPILSCCMLAVEAAGQTVRTIEGLATPEGPSPLQRAFDVSGALQCGFCQPGMILSATALLEQNPTPTRHEIKEALAGNLCRCTGYTKIYEAIERVANDDVPSKAYLQGPPSEGRIAIGARGRKPDSIGKATGETVFAHDIQLPRMAVGRILRSPHAHARILGIDTSAAEALDGVYAVCVGADMPINYGIIPWTMDEHVLCIRKVRHIGDGVAAVAAKDDETARAAIAAIKVEYEVLPAVMDPKASLGADAPLIHEIDWKDRQRTSNLCKEVALEFGDVDAAWQTAAAKVEGQWRFEGSTHAAIEPHCAVAKWSPDGHLTLWSSTQVTHYLHREIARVLEIPPSHVRVIKPAVGGAFGGKSEPFDLEFCAAYLARKAGRPVKFTYDRDEVFYAHRGRHPMDFDFRMSADAQGNITVVDHDTIVDGGAYHSFGLVTTYYSGQLLAGPLRFANYRFRSRRVYTTKPACGPKRGHGSVQPRFPLETALDELAVQLGMDPIEIRRVNAMESGEKTVNDMQMGSCGIRACLDAVEEASGWKERYANMPPNRGLGVATSMYISGTAYPIYPNDMPQSGVVLRADRSGQITVFSGTCEIGQGSDAMLQFVVAEETGVPLERIVVHSGDTELTPVDLGSYSSRVTLMAGEAAREAGKALRDAMVDAVAAKFEVDPSAIAVGLDEYRCTLDDRVVDSQTALQLAEAKIGTLATAGSFRTIAVGGDYRGGTIGASPAYSTTAHVAEVEVDPDTGVVRVIKVWAAHDCGTAIHPVSVEGQIEGSVYMGVSEVLFEDMAYRDNGLHMGPNLLDYRMATSLDTPEIQAIIVEDPDPNGPYGAKEAGEGPLHPSIPAIANAIRHATGARLMSTPFTPDKVLAAIRAANAADAEVG